MWIDVDFAAGSRRDFQPLLACQSVVRWSCGCASERIASMGFDRGRTQRLAREETRGRGKREEEVEGE